MYEYLHVCPFCGFEYRECRSAQSAELESGTDFTEPETGSSFAKLPASWHCPICGAIKDVFRAVEVDYNETAKFAISLMESATAAYLHPYESAKSEKMLARLCAQAAGRKLR